MSEPLTDATYSSDASSLGEQNRDLELQGYDGQFAAAEGEMVKCFSCHELSAVGDFTVDAFRRTEGASDPDDMTAVVALSCPRCSTKGTLVLNYGPESTVEDQDVLRLLDLERDRASGGQDTQ